VQGVFECVEVVAAPEPQPESGLKDRRTYGKGSTGNGTDIRDEEKEVDPVVEFSSTLNLRLS